MAEHVPSANAGAWKAKPAAIVDAPRRTARRSITSISSSALLEDLQARAARLHAGLKGVHRL